MTCRALIDKLNENKSLAHTEWVRLIETATSEDRAYAAQIAGEIAVKQFGKAVFFRGIIEFTNYCKNDCKYCGIRRSNSSALRYRLSKQDILQCCEEGYASGFRTFVLQGGEDAFFTKEIMCDIITAIKESYPDCAVTLSIGEKSREEYEAYFKAGADRYLLRHETADAEHYAFLHPSEMSLANRLNCLQELKDIGYQTGCGFMVGTPKQTAQTLAEDMELICRLKPHMVGVGPFLPHKDTPFGEYKAGNIETALFLLSLLRIMQPKLLLPATTALGTLSKDGRARGVLCGCNVIMPNLSPLSVRKKYMLYNGKEGTEDTPAEGVALLKKQMSAIGYYAEPGRGDYKD